MLYNLIIKTQDGRFQPCWSQQENENIIRLVKYLLQY